MEFIQLKCPNCNAMLEVEDTLDMCYCKYCGTKILISGQSDSVIKAKTELKMADKRLELEKERHRQKMEAQQAETKRRDHAHVSMFLFYVAMMVFMVVMFYVLMILFPTGS